MVVDGAFEEEIGLWDCTAAHAKHFGRVEGTLLIGKG